VISVAWELSTAKELHQEQNCFGWGMTKDHNTKRMRVRVPAKMVSVARKQGTILRTAHTPDFFRQSDYTNKGLTPEKKTALGSSPGKDVFYIIETHDSRRLIQRRYSFWRGDYKNKRHNRENIVFRIRVLMMMVFSVC
jgi:hypothetical protein